MNLDEGLESPSFAEVYASELTFVWRNLRRLGVAEENLTDAAQDVFVVVHRRLSEFEGRAPLRSWVYSIVRRVACDHQRRRRRKDLNQGEEPDQQPDRQPDPQHAAEQSEELRLLLRLLDELDEDKREAFLLSDLEEMSAPEIAATLSINLNTVYSRVRAARQELRAALDALRRKER
jgi:RNA polymerase sigma-70 factor (ECF subfamily)